MRKPKPSGPIIPPVVSAFTTAAGISSPTEISALTALYNALVAAGIWNILDRIYPMSPTSLTAASYCMKSLTKITWVNAPSCASQGIVFDGSTQYGLGDINMNSLPIFNNGSNVGHISAYLQAFTNTSGNRNVYGVTGHNGSRVELRKNVTNTQTLTSVGSTVTSTLVAAIAPAFYVSNRLTSADLRLYKDGVQASQSTTAAGTPFAPDLPMAIGAASNGGIIQQFLGCTIGFFSIGGNLSAQNETDFNTAVQTYETAIGRGGV